MVDNPADVYLDKDQAWQGVNDVVLWPAGSHGVQISVGDAGIGSESVEIDLPNNNIFLDWVDTYEGQPI